MFQLAFLLDKIYIKVLLIFFMGEIAVMGILKGKINTGKKRRTQNDAAAKLPEPNKKSLKYKLENLRKSGLFNSIRTKLIAGFLITIIPIVLLGYISYNNALIQ